MDDKKHKPEANWQLATQTIHGGHQKDNLGALVSPLYQTATFQFETTEQGSARFSGDESGYIYTRLGNPTTCELERRMAILEHAESAAATASGMAAVSAALLANLSKGDHLIASKAIYGCTFSLLMGLFSKFGIEVTLADFHHKQHIISAIKPNTKVIFCETPVNPHLDIFDLEMLANIAKTYDLISIVDNTFMTPLLQRPLLFGIDMVVHSATKYLNGHGDVIAGIVCSNHQLIEKVKNEILKDIGGIISPHDAWLILRGIKTLDVRMQRHCDNAYKIAVMLEDHPKVKKVYYPNLRSHHNYHLAQSQMKAAGGVIAFEIKGNFSQTAQFVNRLSLFTIAVSLGDPESLIQHPASMTHSAYTPEARIAAGITDNLLRISVGLENVNDLIDDLTQALMD